MRKKGGRKDTDEEGRRGGGREKRGREGRKEERSGEEGQRGRKEERKTYYGNPCYQHSNSLACLGRQEEPVSHTHFLLPISVLSYTELETLT